MAPKTLSPILSPTQKTISIGLTSSADFASTVIDLPNNPYLLPPSNTTFSSSFSGAPGIVFSSVIPAPSSCSSILPVEEFSPISVSHHPSSNRGFSTAISNSEVSFVSADSNVSPQSPADTHRLPSPGFPSLSVSDNSLFPCRDAESASQGGKHYHSSDLVPDSNGATEGLQEVLLDSTNSKPPMASTHRTFPDSWSAVVQKATFGEDMKGVREIIIFIINSNHIEGLVEGSIQICLYREEPNLKIHNMVIL